MSIKSWDVAPGLANAQLTGHVKIANDPPPGLTRRGKCSAVAGGGGEGWAQLELADV